jgi:capsular polysaccharide biosynthesis protein
VLALLRQEQILPQKYTAEAAILLSINKEALNENEAAQQYLSLNESRALENARYIVLSDAIAGEVRREFANRDSNLVISAPYIFDTELGLRTDTTFIFIDATASEPQIAIDAANATAERALLAIGENLEAIKDASIYERAFLKDGDSKIAANPGKDLTGSSVPSVENVVSSSPATSLDIKSILIAVFIGLFGSAFCFCAYEILNRKIRTAHDAEALVGIPVIAQLPALEGLDSTEAQCELGVIVSATQVFLAKNDKKVIGFGSIADSKTSEAVAARLVDEMKILGVKAALIARTDNNSVSLDRQRQLVEQTGLTNDVIMVDIGALANSADATAIAATTDAVLLVTQAHKASAGQIKKAIQQLQIADIPLLGSVLIAKAKKYRRD